MMTKMPAPQLGIDDGDIKDWVKSFTLWSRQSARTDLALFLRAEGDDQLPLRPFGEHALHG